MSNIEYCERLKSRIENHSHYGPCMNGSVYEDFKSERDKLYEIRNCYDELIRVEKELIDDKYKLNNKEREIENIRRTKQNRFYSLVSDYNDKRRIKSQEYDNEIQRLKNIKENKERDTKIKIQLLEQDINNLKIEIEKLNSKFENEVNDGQKIALNEIKNEYKLKILKYENEKKKEIEIKKKDMAIRKEEFEATKECEINDMKNKSSVAKKLAIIFKNMSLTY